MTYSFLKLMDVTVRKSFASFLCINLIGCISSFPVAECGGSLAGGTASMAEGQEPG
jgi:hypothetical protein